MPKTTRTTYYDGEIVERAGFKFRVNFENDDDGAEPWAETDGMGVVSDWVTRSKRAGERVLCRDSSMYRYYDHAASIEKANKDGWGLSEENKAELLDTLVRRNGRDPSKSLTSREINAEAVERDFRRIKDFLDNKWCYLGVVITRVDQDESAKTDYKNAVWRVESDGEYSSEVADEIMDEYAHELFKEATEAAYWESRGVLTGRVVARVE